MGKKSRDKGAGGEYEVRDLFRAAGWLAADRDLDQVRGCDNGRDLINTSPYCVQVKRYAKPLTDAQVEQALHEAELSVDDCYRYPVVFYRADRKPWGVALRAGILARLLGCSTPAETAHWKVALTAEAFFEIAKHELRSAAYDYH